MDAIDRLAFSLEWNQWKWSGDSEYREEMRKKAINAIKQIVKEMEEQYDCSELDPSEAMYELYYDKKVEYSLPSDEGRFLK